MDCRILPRNLQNILRANFVGQVGSLIIHKYVFPVLIGLPKDPFDAFG
jgi:hypothetical protein